MSAYILDLVTSASDAMKIAYAASLRDVMAKAEDPEQREGLSGLLEGGERRGVVAKLHATGAVAFPV